MSQIVLVIIWNVLVCLFMRIDKQRARRKKYRISERTLLLIILCLGGVGGLLGMFLWHHKTKKWYFFVTSIVSIGFISYILMFFW